MAGSGSEIDALKRRGAHDAEAPLPTPRSVEDAGGPLALATYAMAGLWIIGTLAVVAALAPGGFGGLTGFQGMAILFMAILPAALLILAGATLREGARARAQARRLADAADRMMNPSPVAEAAARRFGISIRSEIVALDRSMNEALSKLSAVDEVIRRQSAAVDKAAHIAETGAGSLVSGLERERETLLRISADLEQRALAIVAAVGKQSQGIADAAQAAEAKLYAVDEAMSAKVASFGAAASLLAQRTTELDAAALATSGGAAKLETALAGALEALSQASAVLESAKRSGDEAVVVVSSTAGAVRAAAAQAADDARRAMEVVRTESKAIDQDAQAALGSLRDTADAARLAVHEVREAAKITPLRPALTSPAETHAPPVARPRLPAAPRNETPEPPTPAPSRADEPSPATRRRFSIIERFGGGNRAANRPEPTPQPAQQSAQQPARAAAVDRWTWRDLFGAEPQPAANFRPANETTLIGVAAAPNDFDPFSAERGGTDVLTRDSARNLAAEVLAHAGVRLDEAFGIAALDRIAARARSGTQARRRAVRDAAPELMLRIAALLDADERVRADAAAFLQEEGPRIAELLSRGRASMSADITRAFLLLDAASS